MEGERERGRGLQAAPEGTAFQQEASESSLAVSSRRPLPGPGDGARWLGTGLESGSLGLTPGCDESHQLVHHRGRPSSPPASRLSLLGSGAGSAHLCCEMKEPCLGVAQNSAANTLFGCPRDGVQDRPSPQEQIPGCLCPLSKRPAFARVLSHFIRVQLSAMRRATALQAPLSVGSSRRERWNGLPFPSPGDLPDPRIEPASLMSSALAGGFFSPSTTWEPRKSSRTLNRLWTLRVPNTRSVLCA